MSWASLLSSSVLRPSSLHFIRDKHLGSAKLGTGICSKTPPVMSTVAYMCLLHYVSDLSKSQVRKMADWDAEDFEPELAPKPVVK